MPCSRLRSWGGLLGELGSEFSAVEERSREARDLDWSEAGGETVGGLMLIEVADGGVPCSDAIALCGPLADRVGDTLGRVASELAGADASVVGQLRVDVVQPALHLGPSSVESARVCEVVP